MSILNPDIFRINEFHFTKHKMVIWKNYETISNPSPLP